MTVIEDCCCIREANDDKGLLGLQLRGPTLLTESSAWTVVDTSLFAPPRLIANDAGKYYTGWADLKDPRVHNETPYHAWRPNKVHASRCGKPNQCPCMRTLMKTKNPPSSGFETCTVLSRAGCVLQAELNVFHGHMKETRLLNPNHTDTS